MLSEALQRKAKHETRLFKHPRTLLRLPKTNDEIKSLASPRRFSALRYSFASPKMTRMDERVQTVERF